MTPAVHAFVGDVLKEEACKAPVLDIGSYNVNGAVRDLFPGMPYVGMDMQPGPGVDVVASSHNIPYVSGSYGTVVCLEMLEHDSNPFRTMEEIHRVAESGALIMLSSRGIGFKKHEYPSDYWRFTAEGLWVLLCVATGHSRSDMRAWEDAQD